MEGVGWEVEWLNDFSWWLKLKSSCTEVINRTRKRLGETRRASGGMGKGLTNG